MGQGYSTEQHGSRIEGQGNQETRTPARSQTSYTNYGQERQDQYGGSQSGVYGSNMGGSTLQNLFASRQ